jgi:stage II sporulation protein D
MVIFMFNKHLIIENDNGKFLYLFIDFNYEFGEEFKSKKKKSKERSLYKNAVDYIKKNKIDFKAGKIFLVIGSLVIGSLLINNFDSNNFQYNVVPKYKYVESIDIFNDDTYKSIVETPQVNTNASISESKVSTANEALKASTSTNVSNQTSSITPSIKNNQINPTSPVTSTTTIPTTNTSTIASPSNNTTTETQVTEAPKQTNTEITTPTVSERMVTLYRYNGTVETISLEDYVAGVVSAEMPAAFNIEALKAQSVLARTYALKKVDNNQVLSDTTSNQVYKDIQELKAMWGSSFDTYYNKVKNAVLDTKGSYLTYNGSYIEAVYHSTSNGMTEDSLAVWGNSYPYLKSVDSHWDLSASSYLRETSKEFDVLSSIIGIDFNSTTSIEVLSRTSSNRIDKIMIGGKVYTGVEARNLLGLRSTDFDIRFEEGKAVFVTRGYGHGVGMSQYGANGMAKEGYKYDEILSHYYPNTQIKKLS